MATSAHGSLRESLSEMCVPSQDRTPRFVVVSPVRDEAQYLERTIGSMVRQSIRPVQWILVNDGSTDGTAEIINRWAQKEPWIVAVHRDNQARQTEIATPSRGMRARQAKEIEAFYAGFAKISDPDWDFLVKLDGDLGFESDFFQKCLTEFATDPRLGISGGTICHEIDGALQVEPVPHFHVRGATKIYRRACWDDIGGVVRGAGWDTLDEVKANMLGWSTRSSPNNVMHYRFTGAANGNWQNAVKNGIWSHICGYHPLYMLLRCGNAIFHKPYLIGAAGLMYGFVLGKVQGVPMADDAKTVRFLRQQQLRRMCFRTSVWK